MIYFNFLAELEKRGDAKRTREEYVRRLRHWVSFLLDEYGKYDITKATTEEVLAYKRKLICSGMTRNTINGKLSTVMLYYAMALEKQTIDENPCPKGLLIPEAAPTIVCLNKKELLAIEEWIMKLPDEKRFAMLCMYATGARPGEIVKMTGNDVKVVRGSVFLRTYHHGWQSQRFIPVMNFRVAAEILKLSWERKDMPLFNVKKRDLIRVANSLNFIREDFHHHLFRYTHVKRLERNKMPKHIIDYLFGEGSIPKVFKKLTDDMHSHTVLKHVRALFAD